MNPEIAYKPPALQDLSDEALNQWVVACVSDRKNGATSGEVASLCRVLKRLAPALAGAAATPDGALDFELTLEALARG